MHLTVGDVDDPVFRDVASGVQFFLLAQIVCQAAVGDFDDQQRIGGFGLYVGSTFQAVSR